VKKVPKHASVKLWKKYEGGKFKGEFCSRCGAIIAIHLNRKTCGKCGFSEIAKK
jgi:ribosomal protein S27AE